MEVPSLPLLTSIEGGREGGREGGEDRTWKYCSNQPWKPCSIWKEVPSAKTVSRRECIRPPTTSEASRMVTCVCEDDGERRRRRERRRMRT